MLAKMYESNGMDDFSRETYKRVLVIDKNNAEAKKVLGTKSETH
jgi:hypothetical protein